MSTNDEPSVYGIARPSSKIRRGTRLELGMKLYPTHWVQLFVGHIRVKTKCFPRTFGTFSTQSQGSFALFLNRRWNLDPPLHSRNQEKFSPPLKKAKQILLTGKIMATVSFAINMELSSLLFAKGKTINGHCIFWDGGNFKNLHMFKVANHSFSYFLVCSQNSHESLITH